MDTPRLLVVDDDRRITELVAKVAQEQGFVVHRIHRGTEFFEAYQTSNPHVVVMDIVMPDTDGFEILNHLFEQESDAQIVIMSGNPSYRPMAARMGGGFELNVIANLAKPFRIANLRQILVLAKRAYDMKLLRPCPDDLASAESHEEPNNVAS